MKQLLAIPLYIQILVALILGTIVGLLANPGKVSLDDQSVTAYIDEQAQALVFTEKMNADQSKEFREVLAKHAKGIAPAKMPELLEVATNRYPEIGQQLEKSNGESIELKVTERSLQFNSDPSGIHVNYVRKYGNKKIVHNLHYDSEAELLRSAPQWEQDYEKYAGTWSPTITWSSKKVGDLFLRLLKMITIPLIVSSLITGVAGLGDANRLGAMFGKTLLYYASTSVLAIAVGILMVNLIQPGVGVDLPGGGQSLVEGEEKSLTGIFLGLLDNMIPSNPVSSLANADFLSIITFSILFAVFIILVGGEAGKTMANFFSSFFEVMMSMTLAIIHLAPIGVFAFIIYATASQGVDIFITLARYMLTVALALGVHAFVTLPILVLLFARRSPFKYFQALSPALMTAFSTASSNGTLPLTMTCVEKRANVSNKTSSFVLPLGATINMDGTALYEAVAVLFIAQATPGFAMSLSSQIIVAVTALLASIGAAGIPHAGLVMMAIVLQAVGLPLEAQGIIIAVDRILDMGRTAVNVWSDSCGCAIIEAVSSNEPTPTPTES